jgi:hypothetical protein
MSSADPGHDPPRPPPSSRASSVLGGSGGGGATATDGGPAGHQSATDAIVATRSGDVLMKHTLLKSDHFPGEGTRGEKGAGDAWRPGVQGMEARSGPPGDGE